MPLSRSNTIEIDGVTFHAELATISRAFIGFEDHGIFTAFLTFEGPGRSWTQGEPARALGGASLHNYIAATLVALGVESWEQVKGQEVFVLRRNVAGEILGFAHRSSDDRWLLWRDLFPKEEGS